MASANVPFRSIVEAYQRIKPFVHQTPVLTCSTFNKQASKNCNQEVELFFKCENLQKTGAFKARGACNAVILAKERPNLKGIVTHSSGNHGQAVAYACSQDVANVPCTVVVPQNTPSIKCEAIRSYGAELVFCESSPTSRKETCAKISEEKGFEIIHPYDNYDVIGGQATIAYEMMKEQSFDNLDAILVPISGGGMCSGIALAAKKINPSTKIIAIEPKGKELGPCLKAQQRLWSNPPQFIDTIAEGIKTQQTGHLTFPILCELIEDCVITVTDEEMKQAMKIVAERMKLVVEASAGASVAAALFKTEEILSQWPTVRKIGVILCGGNIELTNFP